MRCNMILSHVMLLVLALVSLDTNSIINSTILLG